MDDPDYWWREALCVEIGPDIFFVAKGESVTAAKAACRMCDVRVQCLADSLSEDIEHGIFGGFGRDERRRLALKVQNGRDPIQVAEQAINRERSERARGSRTPVDVARRRASA